MLHQNEDIFDKKWVDTFYDEKAFFLHTLNYIQLTKGLLESTGCEFYFTSISDLKTLGTDIPHQKGHGENLRNTPNLQTHSQEYNLEEYRHILQGKTLALCFRSSCLEYAQMKVGGLLMTQGNKWIELHPCPNT